ncbi:anti-silencing protein [Atractiella rhizophila]|nr:anti-silencing protein [Atractiella rhizophila]
MSLISIHEIKPLGANPAPFSTPIQFSITFSSLSPKELPHDLEWQLIYIGDPKNSPSCDQVLDEIAVGPVPTGANSFVFDCQAPDPKKVPNEHLLGVSVLLVTASYKGQAFVKVGYYVEITYDNEELNAIVNDPEQPNPEPPLYDRLVRNITMIEDPRVTQVTIDWSD